jgi:hypothetical protein
LIYFLLEDIVQPTSLHTNYDPPQRKWSRPYWHAFKMMKSLAGKIGELDHYVGVQNPAKGPKIIAVPYSTFEDALQLLSFISGFNPARSTRLRLPWTAKYSTTDDVRLEKVHGRSVLL